MKTSLSFWKNINTSEFIIDIIKSGYTIPFVNEPENIILKNNKSALDHTEFVEKAIKELSDANLIREESSRHHVVNPLTVSISSGKDRLILDLRHVSKQVRLTKCKFEDQETDSQYLISGPVVQLVVKLTIWLCLTLVKDLTMG